ncbi:hypothetical protein FRB99_008234, partial [Tulasnella sp. 403]
MSDDEDDYLSAKFVDESAMPGPASKRNRSDVTYHERRRQAAKISHEKNKANKIRPRREVEEESRREGLSKSLFERAREEDLHHSKRRRLEDGESDGETEPAQEPPKTTNKALAMMLKMGYKEGQSLGRKTEPVEVPSHGDSESVAVAERKVLGHLTEPLPLAVWAGRQGLGRGKRVFAVDQDDAGAGERKTATEQAVVQDYRNRAREEFEEKRDYGRLAKARKTLFNLDEKHGIEFNIFWIDPDDVSTIPEDLRRLLEVNDDGQQSNLNVHRANKNEADRLRAKMQADALQPLPKSDSYEENDEEGSTSTLLLVQRQKSGASTAGLALKFDEDTIQDTRDWLVLA